MAIRLDPAFSSSLELLLEQNPGCVVLDTPSLAKAIGWHPGAVRNALSKGTFPIPSFKIACKRVFYVKDVADYIDRLRNGLAVPLLSHESTQEKAAA